MDRRSQEILGALVIAVALGTAAPCLAEDVQQNMYGGDGPQINQLYGNVIIYGSISARTPLESSKGVVQVRGGQTVYLNSQVRIVVGMIRDGWAAINVMVPGSGQGPIAKHLSTGDSLAFQYPS